MPTVCYQHIDNDSRLAGADLKELKDLEFSDAYLTDFPVEWAHVTKIKKPVIAAVSGFAVRLLSNIIIISDGRIEQDPS